MKNLFKILVSIFAAILFIFLISSFASWLNVVSIKTVGVATQNAKTEVFEQSNSFTKAKRQEIIKYYKEWNEAETLQEKEAIKNILSMSLADFNEDRYIDNPKLLLWVKNMKY